MVSGKVDQIMSGQAFFRNGTCGRLFNVVDLANRPRVELYEWVEGPARTYL